MAAFLQARLSTLVAVCFAACSHISALNEAKAVQHGFINGIQKGTFLVGPEISNSLFTKFASRAWVS